MRIELEEERIVLVSENIQDNVYLRQFMAKEIEIDYNYESDSKVFRMVVQRIEEGVKHDSGTEGNP